MREKNRQVAKHCVFPMSCRAGGQKSRLDKVGCGSIWLDERSKIARRWGTRRIVKLSVKKTVSIRALWDFELLKSARRGGTKHTSRSRWYTGTSATDHFWKLRCRKSARRCGGANHVFKSKNRGSTLASKSVHDCGARHVSKSTW